MYVVRCFDVYSILEFVLTWRLGILWKNSTSVPEGRHAISLQTARLQLMFKF